MNTPDVDKLDLILHKKMLQGSIIQYDAIIQNAIYKHKGLQDKLDEIEQLLNPKGKSQKENSQLHPIDSHSDGENCTNCLPLDSGVTISFFNYRTKGWDKLN